MVTSLASSENSGSSSDKSTPILTQRDQNKINQWVTEQFHLCKNQRWRSERQWILNLAFYFGHQWSIFKSDQALGPLPGSLNLWTPPAPYYASRPVINRIRPIIRTEISKLTSQKPNAFVIPASSEDRDLFAAQAGEQIWDTVYRRKKVARVLRRAAFWTTVCGTAFIKAFWDENEVDEDSNQQGDFFFSAETPFHVLVPDLKEEELEFQPYMLHATMKNADWVEANYGFRPTQSAGAPIVEETLLNTLGVNGQDQKVRNIMAIEAWIRPNQFTMLPEGGLVTLIGDRVVQFIPGNPFLHGKYPFAKIDHVPTGKFYSDSVITDLIPLQKELNRTRGQIIEAKNRMAKPQLAAEAGSIDPKKITSEPGQVILYKPGFAPPTPIALTPLPNYVLEELDRILMDMSDISGQHEVTRGQVPPGVTAATAISYLQEQDESKLSHTFDSLEEAIEKIAHMTLSYVVQFWDTQRTVRVVGSDGSFDTLALKGSDLRSNTDIKIEAGSALPTSRAAKQAFILDLMKMGFIDPQKGLEVMEIGGINKIYESFQVDVRQAQRENLKMAGVSPEQIEQHNMLAMQEMMQSDEFQQDPMSGAMMDPTTGEEIQPPLIISTNSYDNHAVHVEYHNKFRKSQQFENAPPHVKELFESHVNEHILALQMQMGGPGGPGMEEEPIGDSLDEEEPNPTQAGPAPEQDMGVING